VTSTAGGRADGRSKRRPGPEAQRRFIVEAAVDLFIERGSAGVSVSDLSFAQLYDCFTPVVLIELEDLGFCGKGEAGAFVRSGATALGGALPINTHGGLLSHSHAGNPGSLFALTESVVQLRGQAGERQVADAQLGLVHAQGGILSSHCTIVLGTGATL